MLGDYVATMKFDISEGINNLKKIDNKALSTAKGLEHKFESVGRKLQSASKNSAKTAMASMASLAVFGAGSAFLNKAAESASTLEESVNAVSLVFEGGADGILKFGDDSVEQVGLSAGAFNQLATQTGALLGSTGLPMSEVTDLTIELTKRAADLASVFDTDVKDAMNAINQAIRGKTQGIRRYVGDVTNATLQTYLFAQGSDKKVKSLTESEKRLLRVKVMMEQTSKAQGDFVNTGNSLANQQRKAQQAFNQLQATIGKDVIPIKLKLVQTVAMLIGKFNSLDGAQKSQLSQFLIVGTAVAGFGAAITPLLFTLGALSKLMGTLTIAVKVLGRAFLLNPLGLFVGAIALLVFAFKDELIPAFAPVIEKFKGLGAKFSELKTAAEPLIEALRPIGTFLIEFLAGAVGRVVEGMTNMIELAGLAATKLSGWFGGDSEQSFVQKFNQDATYSELPKNNNLFNSLGGGAISQGGKTLSNNNQTTNNSPRTVNVNQTNNISGVANSGAAVNIIKAGAKQAVMASDLQSR